MNLVVAAFILLISLGFLFVGYLIRFDKRSNYSFITGFFLIMLCGLFLLSDPVEFRSGHFSEIDSFSFNNLTYFNESMAFTYEPIPSYQNNTLAMVLVLAGLWGVIVSTLKIKNWDETEKIEE